MIRRHDNPSPPQSCVPDCSFPIKKCIPRREHLAQVICQNANKKNKKMQGNKTTFEHAQTILEISKLH